MYVLHAYPNWFFYDADSAQSGVKLNMRRQINLRFMADVEQSGMECENITPILLSMYINAPLAWALFC